MKSLVLLVVVAALLQSCAGNGTKEGGAKKGDTIAAVTFPAESIFNMPDTFKTQNNADFTLAKLQGKPTVMAMIFTHCGYACPRITADMVGIREKLGAKTDKVNFLLVSFDVARDTPGRLQEYMVETGLTPDWILLHGSDQAARTLSVLLNLQFEKDAEGNFSHSNIITVLDKNGVLNFQKEGLESDHKETIADVEKLIQ